MGESSALENLYYYGRGGRRTSVLRTYESSRPLARGREGRERHEMSRSGGGDDQIETVSMSVHAIKAWRRACGSGAKKLRSDENPLGFIAVEMAGQQGGWRAGHRRRLTARQAGRRGKQAKSRQAKQAGRQIRLAAQGEGQAMLDDDGGFLLAGGEAT